MRDWTHHRISSGDFLAPWALRGRVASACGVLSGLCGENFPDGGLTADRLQRGASAFWQPVGSLTEWTDTEQPGASGWREIDSLSYELQSRGGMLKVGAFVRWKDDSGPNTASATFNGYPRQLGLRVNGEVVAVSAQHGNFPGNSDFAKHEFRGFLRLRAGLLIPAGLVLVEIVYRLFVQDSHQLVPTDDPRITRFYNRRMLLTERAV